MNRLEKDIAHVCLALLLSSVRALFSWSGALTEPEARLLAGCLCSLPVSTSTVPGYKLEPRLAFCFYMDAGDPCQVLRLGKQLLFPTEPSPKYFCIAFSFEESSVIFII